MSFFGRKTREDEAEKAAIRKYWVKSYEQAVQQDGWGQVIEAVEGYERLTNDITMKNDISMNDSDRETLEKLLAVLRARAATIQDTTGEFLDGPSKQDMELLIPTFQGLFTGKSYRFPLDVAAVGGGKVEEFAGGKEVELQGGSLLPRPTPTPRATYISIFIEKLGIKDAESYIDPYITLSVYDDNADMMESSQDTPLGTLKKPFHIMFGCTAYVQTPLHRLENGNCALFFEFKHYKPKKKYRSCRCWAFMEMDEVREGDVALELYKKPCDPTRRSIRLHSVKDLFLNMRIGMLRM